MTLKLSDIKEINILFTFFSVSLFSEVGISTDLQDTITISTMLSALSLNGKGLD